MSGHSKWSKVKHQKATTDVVKAAAFTKASHAITIAVREGGGTDPDTNFRLRLAVEKAREVNMPKENIERAIAKAAGIGAAAIESVVYEGYGPGGVAFLVEAATDNRQRTVATIKNALDHHGGNLAGPGAVAYLFKQSGVLVIEKTPAVSYERLLEAGITSGADDVVDAREVFEVYTPAAHLAGVKHVLEEQGIVVSNAELVMRPTTTISLDEQQTKTIEALEEELSELPDVQRVYTNVA